MQHHLDWLGISIDASSDALHVAIGRASKRDIDRGASTNLEHLKNMWKLAKTLGYGLKLNTVVSRPTLDHDMSQLVVELLPDRWKVFQVLPVRGENDDSIDDMHVSDAEFTEWVQRHRSQVKEHGINIVARATMTCEVHMRCSTGKGVSTRTATDITRTLNQS